METDWQATTYEQRNRLEEVRICATGNAFFPPTTHLDPCSQELNQFGKFHSNDYITGLERWATRDLRNSRERERQGQ